MGTRTSQFDATIDQILGYLNFSSGAHDPTFFIALNSLFAGLASAGRSRSKKAAYERVHELLLARLGKLPRDNPVFENSDQARRVIELCFDHVLPAYLDFHRDVLFHQSPEFLFNSFFVGRVLETILGSEPLNGSVKEQLPRLLGRLNDFLGHRPIAVLETQKMEPYPHEWIRPLPLFIQNVGAAEGPYQKLIETALEILRHTEPRILLAAQFDPDKLYELALDPRSLDFDHPVNRRPNHHFGQWDEHSVDNRGYYRRFILHQITLDALLRRCGAEKNLAPDQLLYEAGAVLACTMLMGSGVSGCGPGAYDSNTNLGKLVAIIAAYRDQFYAGLIEKLPSDHRQRLKIEAQQRHQPFGAARQDINNQLGAQRDRQLVNCMLASLYARMGYEQAALKQADVVPVASARINCHLDCLLSSMRRLTKAGELSAAAEMLPRFFAQLQRGIGCGAIVDPWNILGCDANYSLFPAAENTIRDHRVDELVELMNQFFAACSRLWAEAAAADQSELCEVIRGGFLEIVEWWRRFAAHEVMSVDAVDPADVYEAAAIVAKALNLWHRGGASTGDLEFWSQHAQLFDSPSAYALVIDALLERRDFNTSRALLVHWLSQADRIPLEQGSYSFHDLLWGWLAEQQRDASGEDWLVASETWNRIRKFYDYLEANAEHYWKVPDFQVGRLAGLVAPEEEEGGEFPSEPEEEDIFGAAYEDVVYHDETDDGVDSPIYETDDTVETELEAEVDRVVDRLQFLESIADYWQIAATIPLPSLGESSGESLEQIQSQLRQRRGLFANWLDQAIHNRDQLIKLLESVNAYDLPRSGVDMESMSQYDRQRLYKESLMQQVAQSCVQVENAIRMLAAVLVAIDHLLDGKSFDRVDSRLEHQRPVIAVFAAVLLRRTAAIVDLFPGLNDHLRQQRLLYIPLSRGGNPEELVQFRTTQAAMRALMSSLPGLGLLVETYELTELAMTMERNWPVDQGAVTEFDELFRVAYTSMIKAVIDTAQQSRLPPTVKRTSKQKQQFFQATAADDRLLFQCVEDLTESMLIIWLEHSRTLRLSVLEKVGERTAWQSVVKFIETYGHDLFTQEFLQLSNVRAILHQGVDAWLYKLLGSELDERPKLLDDIGQAITHRRAVGMLTLILEAIIENYGRYRDYNATTTQSDRGEMLYVLLDFLRLERRYDRVCWHLKPVVLAHQMLVRCGETGVARSWRRSLNERVGSEATRYLTRLRKLREKYSVQMASIGRHLEGKFVQPMLIDRLVALVEPAMRASDPSDARAAFEMLQTECDTFARSATGVGMDLPEWLAALEEEIENVELPPRLREGALNTTPLVAPIAIPVESLLEQLRMLSRRPREQ